MSIVIQPYLSEHESAVRAFNERLLASTSDPDLVFYETSLPRWLPRIEGSHLYNQYFVALEGAVVRGAYALKYEHFFVRGRGECVVACYHHPLSEGIINRAYSGVGALMLRDALQREPVLYALGMGGYERPLPKMLRAMGWSLHFIPFYFRVVRKFHFLRQMTALRNSLWRRWLVNLGAFSGLGSVGISALQSAQRLRGLGVPAGENREVAELPDWTDVLWSEAKDTYRVTSVRDHKNLLRLYPASDEKLTKVAVFRQSNPIGWAVIGERRKDPKYGSLRVGSIIDCWAHPKDAAEIIRAATRAMEAKQFDLILSNQSHRQWCRALEISGFLPARSNFLFACSKSFAASLQPIEISTFHLNRANGDGLPRNF